MPAGIAGDARRHLLQETDHVLKKIAGHDGGRNGRVADHLAGQHQRIRCGKYPVKMVEKVDGADLLVAIRRADLHLEFLVAVDRIDQGPLVVLLRFAQHQVGDVARDGVALVAESLPPGAAEYPGQFRPCVRAQRREDGKLLVQAEVGGGDAQLAEVASDLPVADDMALVAAVVGDDYGDFLVGAIAQSAIGKRLAEFQQAVETASRLLRSVGHRDDNDEAVTVIIATRRDELLQLPERPLIRFKQRLV